MHRTPMARLAWDTRRRFGVFDVLPTCRRLGIAPSTVSRMVARGEAQRLHPGVVGLAAWPDSWERRAVALQLAAAAPNAITGLAAARVLGLRFLPLGTLPRLRVIVPYGARRTPRGLVAARRGFDITRVLTVGPFVVTDVAWTLAESAVELSDVALRRGIEGALADGRTTMGALVATASALRNRRGSAAFRSVLAAIDRQVARTASADERTVLRWVTEAGLPDPVVNLEVRDADGRRRVLDLAWPQLRVCVEIDVHPEHGLTIGRHRDGRRQNALASAWTVLRFDAADLADRAYVVSAIARALREAGAVW